MANKKEKILSINFDKTPDVKVRVITSEDSKTVMLNKKRFPFQLNNSITIYVKTTKREFEFVILNGYTWNGADIPRIFWKTIGSRTDNDFLIASMLHDFLLEFKVYMINDVLKKEITVNEYRRLTSLIFRHVIKEQGTNTIKANIMAWFIDVYQILNKRNWQCQ